MGDTIYIIKTLHEAKLLQNLPIIPNAKVLSLSPAMEKILRRNNSAEIITSDEAYVDLAHIKTIVYIKNCIAEFASLAKNLGTISDLQIEVTLYNIFYVYSTAAFFFQILKKYRKFYFFQNDKIIQSENFKQAFISVMSEFFADSYNNKEHDFSPLHRHIMSLYNSHIINKLKAQKKLLILDDVRSSSKNFATEILRQDKNFSVLRIKTPSKSIITTLRYITKSLNALKTKNYLGDFTPIYFVYAETTKNYEPQLEQIIGQISNRFHNLTLQAAKPFILNLLNKTAGYEASTQVKNLNPHIVISDTFYKPSILATAKAAADVSAEIIAFNHASHTPQSTPVSKAIGNLWARLGRVQNPYATVIAARSPSVAKLVSQLTTGKAKLVNLKTIEKQKRQTKDGKFNFLFAGNYLPIDKHVPWITEDPYEFSKGIYQLVETIAKLPDARLTIRIKEGKSEFDMEALRAIIAQYPNIEINNQGSFKDALTKTDIMIANISTTIDEALQSGVPVLLHSHRKRYRHLAAMVTSPTISNRSAVYASSQQTPFSDFLENIIKAHHNKPLTAAELAPFIWPDETADMAALVKQILETSA